MPKEPTRSRGAEVAEQLMRIVDHETGTKLMPWEDAYDTLGELRDSIDARLEALRDEHPEAKDR